MTWDLFIIAIICVPVSFAVLVLAELARDWIRAGTPEVEPPPTWNGIDYCSHPSHPPTTPAPAMWETIDATPCVDDVGDGGTWAAATWCDAHAPADATPAR